MADEMVTDGVDGVRTTRMLEKAVRQRWPIPEEYKAAIIKRQAKIAVDPKSTARESASAAKTVIAADRLNQADEHEANKEPDQHLHLHQQIPHSKIFFDLPPVAQIEDIKQIESTEVSGEPTGTS